MSERLTSASSDAAIVARALELYGDDDLELSSPHDDVGVVAHPTDQHGAWVRVWVWVPFDLDPEE